MITRAFAASFVLSLLLGALASAVGAGEGGIGRLRSAPGQAPAEAEAPVEATETGAIQREDAQPPVPGGGQIIISGGSGGWVPHSGLGNTVSQGVPAGPGGGRFGDPGGGMPAIQSVAGVWTGQYQAPSGILRIQFHLEQNGAQIGGQANLLDEGNQPLPIVQGQLANGVVNLILAMQTMGPNGQPMAVPIGMTLQPDGEGLSGIYQNQFGQGGRVSLRR